MDERRIDIDEALSALDHMDDFARMANVDPIGPRNILLTFTEQVRNDRAAQAPAASAELRCRKCGERANVSISSASLVAHWSDGTPRDELDIASDPEGKLIHDPSEPLRAAPVAAQAQAVVNKQLTTEPSDRDLEDDEALADTQRAIIEAAERRGYARAMAECAQDRDDAERYRWAQQFMRLDDVGDDQYSLGLVIDSERLEGCVSDEAARLDYERNQQRWANVKSPDDEPADIPVVTLNDAIDAARAKGE